jgi:hypothetical protein
MTERPPSQQPHPWVPYGSPDIEEICSLCGVISTSTEADEPCGGILDDMPDPPAGWEELAAGETDESPALIERLKEPGSAIAPGRDDIVAGMVAAITNWQLGHGEPEEICKASQPSLAAVLGAWWDEHFTRGEAASEVTSQPP